MAIGTVIVRQTENNSFFYAMTTEKEILTQVKEALERKGAAMDGFELYIRDGRLELVFTDAYNCECKLASGSAYIELKNRTIEDLVYAAKDIMEAWRTIITTADHVYIGE